MTYKTFLFVFILFLRFSSIRSIETLCIEDVDTYFEQLQSSDNYLNISNALYPPNQENSLFVYITIVFNSTAPSSDFLLFNQEWLWSLSCAFQDLDLMVFPKISLGTIYPSKKTTFLTITIRPFCDYLSIDSRNQLTENVLSRLQSFVDDPDNPGFSSNTVDCVCQCAPNRPMLQNNSLRTLFSLSLAIGIITAITVFCYTIYKIKPRFLCTRMEYKPLDDVQIHNVSGTWMSLLSCSSFWLSLVVVVVPSVGIYVLAWALSSEQGYFRSGAIAYIVIYSVFLVAWFVVYFKLSYKWKNVTWSFFDYKSLASWEFPFFVISHVMLLLIVFPVAFEVTWAFLGMFLDPHWAIPLVAIYGAIVVHITIWGERIYFSVSPLKLLIKSQVLKQALAWIIKKEMSEVHIKDIRQSPLYRFVEFIVSENKEYDILDSTQLSSLKSNVNVVKSNKLESTDISSTLSDLSFDVSSALKDTPWKSKVVLEKFLEQEKNLSNIDKSYIERIEKYLNAINDISSYIQITLGCSPKEMILLGFGIFAILILLFIFVFWGFTQFSKQSIGLTLLQSVLVGLFAVVSGWISTYKKLQKEYLDSSNSSSSLETDTEKYVIQAFSMLRGSKGGYQ